MHADGDWQAVEGVLTKDMATVGEYLQTWKLIPASSTPPSTTPYELWLDACVLHQRITFQSSQASNLLTFVPMEPHCLQHDVPWSLDICSTQRSPIHREQTQGASNRDTHLYPPHNNSSFFLTTTYVRRTGRIINGMRIGRTTHSTPHFHPRHRHSPTRNDPCKKSLGPS